MTTKSKKIVLYLIAPIAFAAIIYVVAYSIWTPNVPLVVMNEDPIYEPHRIVVEINKETIFDTHLYRSVNKIPLDNVKMSMGCHEITAYAPDLNIRTERRVCMFYRHQLFVRLSYDYQSGERSMNIRSALLGL